MAEIRVRRKAVVEAARRSLSIGVRRRLASATMPPAVYIPVRRRRVVAGSGIGAARGGPTRATRQGVEPLGRWAKPLLAGMILVVLGPLVVTTCARLVLRETAQGVAVPSGANGPVDVDEAVDGVPLTGFADPGAELTVGPLAAAAGGPAEPPTIVPTPSPTEPTAGPTVEAETPTGVTTAPAAPSSEPEEAAEAAASIPAPEPPAGGEPEPPNGLARAEPELPTLATEELVTNLPFGQPERLVSLDGRRVWLTRARVQGRASDRAVWIGPRPDQRMLVLLPEGALTRSDGQDAAIEAGRAVDVRGAIRGLPAEEEMLAGWGLSEEDLRLVEEGAVYLQVDDVRDFRIVGDP